MLLPNVTKLAGTGTFSATWHLNFQIKLSMGGSTCSDPNQYSEVLLTLQVGIINWSAGNAPSGSLMTFYHMINTSVSSTWKYNQNVSVSAHAMLSAAYIYAIETLFTYTMDVQVTNSQPGDTDSCKASAVVTPLSGTTLATLQHIVLIVT